MTVLQQTRFWLCVISKEHALNAKKMGLIAANHGKKAPLQRMKKNDGVVIYSHKMTLDGKEPLQAFSAIGIIKDDEIFQADWNGFSPFVRKIDFLNHKQDVPIRPLLDNLSFTKGKKSWGFQFRFGCFEIAQSDFELIKTQMTL